MKHLKTYENVNNNEPKIGDYVLCEINNLDSIFSTNENKYKLDEFVKNNIGIIVRITQNEISVKYHDVPFYITHFFNYNNILNFNPDEIVISSLNLEDIKKEYELRFTSNKYNL
jgi:hypothetical protein